MFHAILMWVIDILSEIEAIFFLFSFFLLHLSCSFTEKEVRVRGMIEMCMLSRTLP
jgi:hypothetical protein